MKKVKETKLEAAKRLSLGYWNRDYSDVFVLFPSQAIYVNTDPSKLEDHIIAHKQEIVLVKVAGKIIEENNEVFSEELEKEPAFGPKKSKKKL